MALAPARSGTRRPAMLALALALGLGLAVSPAGARPVVAAEPLRVSADASYTLDPAAGRVHVVIRYRVTDLKPNSADFIYYYTGYRFAVQREATSIRASDGGGALSVATRTLENYIELTVDFRNNIYYRDTATFTVRYDILGGKPRTASSIRVGKAFATWGVWAWGDPGRGSVVVNLPAGFTGSTSGDPMSKASTGGKDTLRASPATPETFFAIVTAENPLAYTQDRLSLEGGVEIVVGAWPEDRQWDRTVIATLEKAMPELRALIGLDWPVTHDLSVRERYTPALEGYAGVYFADQQRIDVSEDLDPVTIVHEASHAWFNQNLFAERWVYEGLAQEYAWRVQQAVGGPSGTTPEQPAVGAPGSGPLLAWSFPEAIRDQRTDDRETFGYAASFWVMHLLVGEAGVDRMRQAFRDAHDNVTAYPGAGPPETVAALDTWHRLVDLAEPIDRPDPTDVTAALTDLVVRPSDVRDLRSREDARDAYRRLLAAGAGTGGAPAWLPGWYIRKPMGEWRFTTAETRIQEAQTVLALRGQVDAAAAALGLTPGDALKAAYETAVDGLGAATALANDELAALAAIGDAKTRVEAEPDLVSKIGLLGSAPQAAYEAARAAFGRGDMAGAKGSAAAAAAMVAGAVALGQQRLAIGIGVAFGLLALLTALLLLRRRRRRRAVAMAGVAAGTGAVEPVPSGPYATLAADPEAARPSTSEPSPDPEGGPARGGSPSDSVSSPSP